MRYIYIYEDGRLGVDTDPPTDDDFLCVNKGLLQVLRISADKIDELGPEGDWAAAPTASVIVACGSEFHEID